MQKRKRKKKIEHNRVGVKLFQLILIINTTSPIKATYYKSQKSLIKKVEHSASKYDYGTIRTVPPSIYIYRVGRNCYNRAVGDSTSKNKKKIWYDIPFSSGSHLKTPPQSSDIKPYWTFVGLSGTSNSKKKNHTIFI